MNAHRNRAEHSRTEHEANIELAALDDFYHQPRKVGKIEKDSGDQTGNIASVNQTADDMKDGIGKHEKTQPSNDEAQGEAGMSEPLHGDNDHGNGQTG